MDLSGNLLVYSRYTNALSITHQQQQHHVSAKLPTTTPPIALLSSQPVPIFGPTAMIIILPNKNWFLVVKLSTFSSCFQRSYETLDGAPTLTFMGRGYGGDSSKLNARTINTIVLSQFCSVHKESESDNRSMPLAHFFAGICQDSGERSYKALLYLTSYFLILLNGSSEYLSSALEQRLVNT